MKKSIIFSLIFIFFFIANGKVFSLNEEGPGTGSFRNCDDPDLCDKITASFPASLKDHVRCPDESGDCSAGYPNYTDINVSCSENGRITYRKTRFCLDQVNPTLDGDYVYGQITPVEGTATDFQSLSGITPFINKIINFLVIITASILLIIMLWSGVQVIIGGKDPKNFGENMKRLLLSSLGLLLIVFAYIIVGFVSKTFYGEEDFLLKPTIKGPGKTQERGSI